MTARLAHQQQPQIVEVLLEVQPALLHRRPRHDTEPAVITRVGIPSVWESTAAK